MAKLRLEITKGEELRYISHLDYAGAIEKAIRRANLPVAYSEGFNPHMKLAFASALAVGVTSEAEYMDIELNEELDSNLVIEKLRASLPPGIMIKAAKYMPNKTTALMAIVNLATYNITVPLVQNAPITAALESVNNFNAEETVIFTKNSPKGNKEINIKEFIASPIAIMETEGQIKLSVVIKITPTGSAKPGDVLAALVNNFAMPIESDSALIHRTGLFITNNKQRVTPMDV